MSKTPYEIRSDLLALAFDILREQDIRKDPYNTQAPSVADILKTAVELRGFVDSGMVQPSTRQTLTEAPVGATDSGSLAGDRFKREQFLQRLDASKGGCCGSRDGCTGGNDDCACS